MFPYIAFSLKFRVKDNFYRLCQFLAYAKFQLIVYRMHWLRDPLVQQQQQQQQQKTLLINK